MQPNEQKQYSQNGQQNPDGYVSPSGANIPEYLHMDPVPSLGTQTKRKTTKRLLLFALGFGVLMFAIMGGLYLYGKQNTPQEMLFRAIENSMKVSYVDRSLSVEIDSSGSLAELKVKSSTDFSDQVNPKSHFIYETKETLANGGSRQVSGEDIIIKETEHVSIIRRSVANKRITTADLNKWYRVPDSSNPKEISYSLSGMDSKIILNSSQGFIPLGNFNDANRLQVMDFIKKNDVYPVIGVQDGTVDGITAIRYTVEIKRNEINELNKRIDSVLATKKGLRLSDASRQTEKMYIWLDSSSDRILKTEYIVDEDKKTPSIKKTIIFSYPEKVSIKYPSDIKDLPADGGKR